MSSSLKQHPREQRASVARALLIVCSLGGSLAGCSFDEETPASPPNTCTLPSDCAPDLSCQAGVCVMPSTDAPLDVTLEVTPQRMPDGSQPFPILYGPFPLQGGRRDFDLPQPVAVSGTIRSGAEVINAQLTFVPTKAPPSLAKPIQARSGLSILRATTFSAQLLAGVEYRMTVLPTESEIPPYSRVFVAERGTSLDVNYAEIPTSKQNFVVRGLPTSGLTIKARAKEGNHILSETKMLGAGRAELTFMSETPPPFRIEITADPSLTSQLLSLFATCDEDEQLMPTFTIDDSAFKREASTRTTGAFDLAIDLPELPEPVVYEGEVQLCTPRRGLSGLPISLRSSALALPNLPPGVSASYGVSVEAFPESERKQSFCTRVLPGEYVVLVTPPAALNCEIFSERRAIRSSTDEPVSLELRDPARLNGKILDGNMLPVANATIDAIALGIDTTTMVADNDLTVPIHNRSRQTSTDSGGSFVLYVDVGVYDLIVKPPSQSGFAWQIQPGVSVGGAREDFATRVELGAPALIQGKLRYAGGGGQSSLAGAEVHAYTVEDERGPNARGVEIGHTQADDEGNVMLLISPEPQTAW